MLQFRQAIEAGNTLGNDVLVRRKQVVGQGFPVREVQNRQRRRKKLQFLLEPLGALAVGGQEQGEALGRAGGFGNGQAQCGTGKIAPVLFACSGRKMR